MSSITVATTKELESAKAKRYKEIIVSGKLAEKKSKKIALTGAVTLSVLKAALASIPFTRGLSLVAAAGAAKRGLCLSLLEQWPLKRPTTQIRARAGPTKWLASPS